MVLLRKSIPQKINLQTAAELSVIPTSKISMNNEISSFATRMLGALLNEPGSLIYSGYKTIQPGKIYLIGLNPGGCGAPPLSESIAQLTARDTNAYLDEGWENDNGSWGPGKAPLQRRIIWLLEMLGENPRDVFASNLIFTQSKNAEGVSVSHANMCWPIHEALLKIVQPEMVIAFGNSGFSPYGYMRNLFRGQEISTPSSHGNWLLKGFHAEIHGKSTFIAGLPHLSRYSPIGKEHIISWLKSGGRYNNALN